MPQSKVISHGKLVAVAYSLRTYWNQFSLGGVRRQEQMHHGCGWMWMDVDGNEKNWYENVSKFWFLEPSPRFVYNFWSRTQSCNCLIEERELGRTEARCIVFKHARKHYHVLLNNWGWNGKDRKKGRARKEHL